MKKKIYNRKMIRIFALSIVAAFVATFAFGLHAIYSVDIRKMDYKLTRGYALGFSDEYQIKYEGERCTVLHSRCDNDAITPTNQQPAFVKVQKKTLSRLSSAIIICAFEYARKNPSISTEHSDVDGYIDRIEDGSGKMIVSAFSGIRMNSVNILINIATEMII